MLYNQDSLEKGWQRSKRRPAVKPTALQQSASVAERGRRREEMPELSHPNALDQDLNWTSLMLQSKVVSS